MNAAAKTSAIACRGVSDEIAEHFKEAAASLLASGANPEDIVARCLAAIARRTVQVESRSLLTGEAGYATVEMTNSRGRPISPGDVMFTVSKLSRMSQKDGGDLQFDGDIGKIQTNEAGNAVFDMNVSLSMTFFQHRDPTVNCSLAERSCSRFFPIFALPRLRMLKNS